MVSIVRTYTFSSAHRIEGHPKCGRLHGHNYKIEVEVFAEELVKGMVLDFAKLDEIVKPVIDELDHRYIVSTENQGNEKDPSKFVDPDWCCFIDCEQSTAENLAALLAINIRTKLQEIYTDVAVKSIAVWETERSYAKWK